MDKIDLEEARRIGAILQVNFKEIDVRQFAEGLRVELEHKDITGGSMLLTGKIALAHLKENKKYYTKLRKYVE